ncbi:MAG: SdpI family protein [Cellulosilyticaceae bacterium]
MKTKNKCFLLALILCIISLIGTVCVYWQLPLEIPIHFNLAGEADGFGHRSMAFFTGILPLGMLVLLKVVPRLDPKGNAYTKHPKAYDIFLVAISIFLIISHWSSLLVALGINLSINKIIPVLIGILFIIIGNYMPQIRQNYTFGMRLPWTLDNEANWRYTQRIGGYCFLGAGIAIILSTFLSPALQFLVLMVAILAILIIPTIASYLFFKKNK